MNREWEKVVTAIQRDDETEKSHWSPIPRFPDSPIHFRLPAFPLLLLLTIPALAANSNPYNGIMDRNVFSLKAPTPVDNTPIAPPAPPVKLTLTGITTILGNKRALLKAQVPARAPEPAKEESYMLTEGQRDGGVEVLSIDERGGIVKVNNNGLPETLDFINHGAKAIASAAPPGIPGVIPMRIPAPPGASLPGNSPGVPQLPARNSGNPQASGNSPNDSAITGSGGGDASTSPAMMHFQGSITPEEQALMVRGQQIHLMDQGRGEEAAMFPNVELPDDPTDEGTPSPF